MNDDNLMDEDQNEVRWGEYASRGTREMPRHNDATAALRPVRD